MSCPHFLINPFIKTPESQLRLAQLTTDLGRENTSLFPMVDARTQAMCSRGQQANLSWAVFIYCGEGFDEEFISGLLG